MTSPERILNWLTIGFEQPTGSITESFYYDKLDNQFFSIVMFDYFMFDENMNRSKDVESNYSKPEEDFILTKIKRIEESDVTIILIPKIDLDERKYLMQQFVDSLADETLIEMLSQQIQKQDYKSTFDLTFSNGTHEAITQEWQEMKREFLNQQIDSFLNLNNIDIYNSGLWLPDNNASSSLTINIK